MTSFTGCAGALPEVEILTRDAGLQAPNFIEEKNGDVYKPRVTTWGVFPRPADISKAVSSVLFSAISYFSQIMLSDEFTGFRYSIT